MTKPSVGIIGCGWLGKALTVALVEQSHDVVVTTQRPDNVDNLTSYGAKVECFSTNNSAEQKGELSVFNQSCLIIAITPMIRQGKTDYADKIRYIVSLAEAGNVEQIIMLSTTAIYNGNVGNVDEECIINTTQDKTLLINTAEQVALEFSGNTVVLRLAGLVGPERHPGKFLSGNRVLSDPTALTNLIHQKDAVGLLLGLISQENHSGIYNGVSHTHVSKRDYYTKAALTLNIPAPQFNEGELEASSKKIIGDKIRKKLGYQFVHDDLLSWLKES